MPRLARPALKTLAFCAAVAAAVAAAPLSAGEAARIRLTPGETKSFAFVENPSTGYTWALDENASRDLDTVAVADGGYRPGGTAPGAPGKHLWSVRGLAPGRAEVVFVYRRVWEPAPVETRRVAVEVAP